MITYECVFSDVRHDFDGEILNTFRQDEPLWRLELTVDGITFTGRAFDDFAADAETYSEQDLEDFTVSLRVNESDEREEHLLEDYDLLVRIPVTLISAGQTESSAFLSFDLETGGTSRFRVELDDDRAFQSTSAEFFFETQMLSLVEAFQGAFAFKTCFGCVYGDYSPYGADAFGSMLCFRACKSEFRKAATKDDFIALADKALPAQETYLCDAFEPRGDQAIGYRGRAR